MIMKRTTKDIIVSILPLFSLAFIFGLWVFVSGNNSEFFPTPAMTLERFIGLIKLPISRISVLGHIWASLRRVLIAFAIASVCGISLGLAMGWNKNNRAFFGPVFEILRPIPPIAWIPLVILWFGVGELPKILLVFIGSFIPIVLNTFTGVKLVEPIYLDVGKVMKANTIQKLWYIVLPAALPAIFAGLRAALSSGWMVVVAAEMIASISGVGFLISRGGESYDIALILCGMIIIGIIGALLAIVLTYVERWLCPWRTERK